MVVMILEKVPNSLRGELTRWMLEVSTGVFVGTVSATVRDLLWEKCTGKAAGGRCCQLYRMNNEQGFSVRMSGDSRRRLLDFDGLTLVAVRHTRRGAARPASGHLDNPGEHLEGTSPTLE